MKADIRDPNSVAVIRPLEVASYLRAVGWEQAEVQEGRFAIWTQGDDFEALLPLRADVGDYALRMGELLALLAKAEDRSQLAILSDLLTTGSDVVRVRLVDDDLADGSMPIEEYSRTAQKTRDLMLAAACAAIEHRPVWHTRKPDQAVSYLRNVRMGQTERGSYVMTVISRVPPMLTSSHADNLFEDDEPPYERAVTSALANALKAAEGAAESAAASGNIDSFENAVHQGVSANFCEALAGLSMDEDASRTLDVSFSWSRTRPVAQDTLSRVTIPHDRIPYLQSAARYLRESSPIEGFELRGPVIKLERAEDAPTGFVTVHAEVDGRVKRVRLELPDAEYQSAVDAHGDGHDVSCTGRLAREGRSLELQQPVGFARCAEE